MAIDLNAVVNWFDARKGLLTYSMTGSRNGTDGTADCSGSITQALRDAGATPYAYLYSTVTLGSYLSANGFTRISENQSWDAQRGDIILMSWGANMAYSGGAGGHVGVMKDSATFISTDYWTGGQTGTAVSEHSWDQYYAINKPVYIEVWRLGDSRPNNKPSTDDTDAIAKFKAADDEFEALGTFKADEVKFHHGIWQLASYQLNGDSDIDWDDNGIPTSCVENVSRGKGQAVQAGDIVKFKQVYSSGTIDEYDNSTNAVGIDTGGYGRIWYNADAWLKI